MTRFPHPPRARAAAVVLVLGGTLLAPVVAAAPASASPECLSEKASWPGGARCDDETAPDTRFLGASPSTNRNGYLRQDSVTITFEGFHTDADTDPIALQCQLYTTAEAPAAWESCTSPTTLEDLDDTGATPYTFRVRAIDTADNAINATQGGLFQPTPASTDVADLDAAPATVSFFVDTQAPNTFLVDEPYDEITPDFPMLTQPRLTLMLTSDEDDALFDCWIDNVARPCQAGVNTFGGLKPGNGRLRVVSSDLAGNVDPTPVSTTYSVPVDLGPRHGQGWTTVKGGGHFAGDYLRTTRRGATLVLRGKDARELRVLAPRGPGYGRIEIQVGAQKPWTTLNQTGGAEPGAVIHQRFFGRKFNGKITIRAKSANAARPAVIDAVLLH